MDQSVRIEFPDTAELTNDADREGADHVDDSPDCSALLRHGILDD